MRLYRLTWDRDGRCDLFASLPADFANVRNNARGVLRFHSVDGFHSINCEARGVTIYSESPDDGASLTPEKPIDATGFEYSNPRSAGDELPELFATANMGASLTISADAAFMTIEDDCDDWGASASIRIPEEAAP